MARVTGVPNSGAADVYQAPEPFRFYRLSVTHGHDAAMERWAAFGARTVQGWISAGHREATGEAPRSRSRSPEERARIVAAVFEHGSPADAARALGITPSAVMATLVTEGVRSYPTVSPVDRAKRARAAGWLKSPTPVSTPIP